MQLAVACSNFHYVQVENETDKKSRNKYFYTHRLNAPKPATDVDGATTTAAMADGDDGAKGSMASKKWRRTTCCILGS